MLQVEVVSPEAITYSGEASMVVARTVGGGDIAFQAGHVPFIGVLEVWSAKVIGAEGPQGSAEFAVHSGFIQMANDKVTILSDVSESKDEIDVDRARTAQANAQAAVNADDTDVEAIGALRRANTRIAVATGEVAH